MAYREERKEAESEFKEALIHTKGVSKTVKGGRVRKFSALVVVGDGNGRVGYGLGKATEVPDAIRKAFEEAKKNIITVSIKGTTIPHIVLGHYGAGEVILKPASAGTGIIAGGTMRSIFDVLGIRDIRAKSLRSNNPINVVKATFEALKDLQNVEEVAQRRDKSVGEIYG